MNVVPIVFAVDNNMVMPAGVALTSLLSNADIDTFYDVFILYSAKADIPQSVIGRLSEEYSNVRITFRPVADEFEGAFEIRDITKTCYYRLLIPKLIPEYEKVLYSDVDVIFRGDLRKYYETEIGDYYFAGVNIVPSMDDEFLAHLKRIGINPDDGYYNSGSLIVNSRLLKEDDKVSEFRRLGSRKFKYQDQDIINITCAGRIKELPVEFNLTTALFESFYNGRLIHYSEKEFRDALNNGTIHYAGAKPWKEVCLNMDIWWEYYRKSAYYDEKFAQDFWYCQTYRIEKMSLWKRIKQVARFFIKGGRK